MGRITDIIPALYHNGDNDLTRFTEILDSKVIRELEQSTRGITNLINIDKCPDDSLPYLAALTNCPLIGNDPVFWRKQIRNWPYILKLKGTQRSLELVLDSIGAENWTIKTFFRDAGGGYITSKPTGKPFMDADGLWHNIRTHYFGIEFVMRKAFVEELDFNWDVEEVKDKLRFWFERGKPYHAELLNMFILPPNFLPDDHICRWDWCNWEHVELKKYFWGLPVPSVPVTFDALDIINSNTRGFITLCDSSLWDVSTWGHVPYRLLQTGSYFCRGIFTELESDDFLTWQIPYSWLNNDWSTKSSFLRPTGAVSFRPIHAEFKADVYPFVQGLVHLLGLVFELGTCWDYLSWPDHYTWAEVVEQTPISYGFTTGFEASLSWDKHNAPKPSWSEHQTWEYADTWSDSTEQFGSWEIGSWKEVA